MKSVATQQDGEELSFYARMFRSILRDLGMTRKTWDELMNRYVKGLSADLIQREAHRKRLNRLFQSPRMSEATFRNEALPFLNPRNAEFQIELTWTGGKRTNHRLRPNTKLPFPLSF